MKADTSEKKVVPEAMQYLVAYEWPGNIRELENLIRYLMVTTPGDYIQPANLPEHIRSLSAGGGEGQSLNSELTAQADNEFLVDLAGMTWPSLEKAYVKALMKKYNWNVTWAARASGVNRSTFASRMRKLEIRRDQM